MRRLADVATLGDSKALYLTGSPYEQGKQLGRGAAEQIRENMRRAAECRRHDDAANLRRDHLADNRRQATSGESSIGHGQ